MDSSVRIAITTLGCGLIGVILAVLAGLMYSGGIIVDEFVSGTITLADVQAAIIIVWMLIGVVLAAVSN